MVSQKILKRFFINHSEACNLCFKSILREKDGGITIPNINTFGKEEFIYEVVEKILKIKKVKYKFKKSKKYKK